MKLHIVPDPDAVLAEILHIGHAIWEALEVGAGAAHHFFHGGEIDDRGLAAHITRYHAKHVLDGLQGSVEFERDDLPNSGLMLSVLVNNHRYLIRVRRSIDGSTPLPQSDTMNNFYWQPVLPEFGQPQPADLPINLMILWRTAFDYSAVTSLTLVCPEVADSGEVHEHWRRDVPHPIAGAVPDGGTAPPSVNEVLAEDLPMDEEAEEDEQSE